MTLLLGSEQPLLPLWEWLGKLMKFGVDKGWRPLKAVKLYTLPGKLFPLHPREAQQRMVCHRTSSCSALP